MNKLLLAIGGVILMSVSMLSVSCKAKKHTAQTVYNDSADRCKLDFKNGKALERLMKAQELKFTTASGKMNVEMKSGEEDNSFNISVRCRKDSVIWLNISKATIDAMRVMITRDSVKFMITTELGGLTKSYFAGDFGYINQKLNADLDYEVIQALLFGNSADFLSDSVKLKGGKDKHNCLYFLSTIRKRRLHKMIEGKPPKESVQTIWLDPVTWKIVTLEYADMETKRSLNSCYGDFQLVDSSMTMPFKLLYTITAEKVIKADIKWTKVKLNEPVSFPYRVPDSYEVIQFKNKE